MRFMFRSPLRLSRLLARVSVRARIILLAVIPVVGFLANGLTYFAGENDVANAFAIASRSNALAGASRDFKTAVSSMRIIMKDFTASPSDNLVVSFEQAHGLALHSLDAIAGSIYRNHAENITSLQDVMECATTRRRGARAKNRLRRHHRLAPQVARRQPRSQRIINENMAWMAGPMPAN